MSLAKITTKGQVTIPKDVREALNLNAGDKIEIIVQESSEALIRPVIKKVDDMFCKLKKSNQQAISVNKMNHAVKQRLIGKFT